MNVACEEFPGGSSQGTGPDPFAEQAGEIEANGIPTHRAEVDEACEFFIAVEEMLRAQVAQARLEAKGTGREGIQ